MPVRPHMIGELRDRWFANGEPYCDHSNATTVQDVGCPPEDLCCAHCGLTWDKGADTPPPSGKNPAAD